jgi:transcriptional regulator with XRE-family HTH domain
LYNRVAEYRHQANLTQQDLATKARVSLPYIKVLECRNPKKETKVSLDIAYHLAKTLDTDIETLFNLTI